MTRSLRELRCSALGRQLETPVYGGASTKLDWPCRHPVPTLRHFVLPGGCPAAAALHVARTTTRSAERRVVALEQGGMARGEVVMYLNRLSDLLFVLARLCNHEAGVEETPWGSSVTGSLSGD